MLQEHSTNLGKVVDIVVSHQGSDIKVALVSQLMSALVLPAPEHYRPLLRRFAALGIPTLYSSQIKFRICALIHTSMVTSVSDGAVLDCRLDHLSIHQSLLSTATQFGDCFTCASFAWVMLQTCKGFLGTSAQKLGSRFTSLYAWPRPLR